MKIENWKSIARRTLILLLGLIAGGCDMPVAERQDDADGIRDVPGWAESTARQEQLGDTAALQLDTLTAARLSGAFRAAADRALPSVVFIRVETGSPAPANPIQRFFGQPDGGAPQIGAGSGFIFDPRGYIMTNNHVVQQATSLMVRLVDGREYPARVIGSDVDSDVAVIKIDPAEDEELPVARLGDGRDLRVGDWVLALGSPFTLDFTVTAGIVSAKGRNSIIPQNDGTALEAFIQTDAAINPGNSGGPLVDLLGRVVGVSTAIYSPSGTYAGYGFAIPIQLALRVARDLIRYGVVHRPQLGVSVADVTADDAQYYGLDRVAGALVRTVSPRTPAARAGLRVGDVIVAIDSTLVSDATELITTLAQKEPGDAITLTFFRNGAAREVDLELGEFERAQRPEPRRERNIQPDGPDFSVIPLDAAYARRVGYEGDGVIVRAVDPTSLAAARGLHEGVIIHGVNRQPVGSITDLERALDRLQPGEVLSLEYFDPQLGTSTVLNYQPR